MAGYSEYGNWNVYWLMQVVGEAVWGRRPNDDVLTYQEIFSSDIKRREGLPWGRKMWVTCPVATTASAEQLRKWERGNATLPSKLTAAALSGCQLQLHKALKHTQTVHLMEFLHWDQWSKTLHFISASTRDKSQQHYAFNVYIQTTRNLIFNTLDVKQHMVALQHSIRSDSVTHSAKIFPETLCVRLSRATLLYTLWTTTAWQCGAFIALEALLKVSLGAWSGVAPHFLPQLSILLHDRHFC